MSTSNQKIKVLLYGNVPSRDRRCRLLIELLHSNNKYCVSQVCPNFYVGNLAKNFFKIEKILALFYWFELLIKAAFADVIYLMPMNTAFTKSAVCIARLLKKKLVAEVYISLYDSLVRDKARVESDSKAAQNCIEKDRLALTKADYLIHTSNHELLYWEQLLNIKIDWGKVLVAPLCSNYFMVSQKSWMQGGVLRICWWGTFIPLHGVDNILSAMKILQERELQFTCELFGVDNQSFPEYEQKICSHQLGSHVLLRKDLNFDDGSLPQYLVNSCDLALGIFGNTDKAANAVPNKLIEALSMEIPTLTMNSPALKEFFNPETDFWTCEPSPESIAATILDIASGAAYPVDWQQTRQKVINLFSVARYREVLSQGLARSVPSIWERETTNAERGICYYLGCD